LGGDGTVVGRLDEDTPGQPVFIPADSARSEPVRVADGAVEGISGEIGRLGPTSNTPSALMPAAPASVAPEPSGDPVFGRDGVIGRVSTAPDGTIWFAPEVPPGAMPATPVRAERLLNGAIVISGRVIGRTGQAPGRPPAPLFGEGEMLHLAVKVIEREEIAVARPSENQSDPSSEDLVPEDGMPTAPPKPESGEPTDAGAVFDIAFGAVRVEIEGDVMIQRLVEDSHLPDVTIPAGTVVFRGRKQGDEWVGKAMTELKDCPNRDYWYSARMQFDADRPKDATTMQSFLLSPAANSDYCTYVPSNNWVGPYTALRVAMPSDAVPVSPEVEASATDDLLADLADEARAVARGLGTDTGPGGPDFAALEKMLTRMKAVPSAKSCEPIVMDLRQHREMLRNTEQILAESHPLVADDIHTSISEMTGAIVDAMVEILGVLTTCLQTAQARR
jgi:hypothetical protein